MSSDTIRLIDDRLLVDHILGDERSHDDRLATTSLWYYRACRASVLGAGGHLSGPFAELDDVHRRTAIRRLLELDESVELAHPRVAVPIMARLAERHTHLNVMNLEAAAAAIALGATVHLSAKAAGGVLPGVLDAERVPWHIADGL